MPPETTAFQAPPAGPYDRVLRIWPDRLTALKAVAWGMLAYVAAHALLRLAFSDVIAVDWVVHTFEAQSLDLGQNPKYPPLPAWALWFVQLVTGPGALATLVIKYAVMWATVVAYFFAARRVLAHDGWAALCAFSLLLIFQIGWNAHEGVTHTQFLTLAMPLTLIAVLRMAEGRRLGDYVLFGCAVALGALSKQAYFAGLGALLAGMVAQRGYRAVLLDWRMGLAALAAVVLAGPHYYWALTSGFDFGAAASTTLADPGITNALEGIGQGLLSAFVAPLLFLSPLLPLVLVAVPRAFRPGNVAHPGAHGRSGADPVQLVRDTLIAALAIMVVPVFVAGVTHYGERWMHPLMVLAPIYLVAMVRASHPTPGQVRAIWVMIIVVSVIAFAWRAAGFVYPDRSTCGKCRLDVPYGALADELRDFGFAGGTIIGADEHIAGNLRAQLPEARIVVPRFAYYDPPLADDANGQCLIVWRVGDGETTTRVPGNALAYAGLSGIPEEAQVHVVAVPHRALLRADGYDVSRFAAVLMDGRGRCR